MSKRTTAPGIQSLLSQSRFGSEQKSWWNWSKKWPTDVVIQLLIKDGLIKPIDRFTSDKWFEVLKPLSVKSIEEAIERASRNQKA